MLTAIKQWWHAHHSVFLGAYALLALLLLNHFGYLWQGLNAMGFAHLYQQNLVLLQQLQKENFDLFVRLGEIDVGLALIQSVRGGLSLVVDIDVQIGNLVTDLRDIIQKSWLVTSWSLIFYRVLAVCLKHHQTLFEALLTLILLLSLAHTLCQLSVLRLLSPTPQATAQCPGVAAVGTVPCIALVSGRAECG